MDESPLQTACDAVAGVPLDVVIRALHHSHKVRLKALSVIEGSRDATLVRPFEASPSAVFSISAIQTHPNRSAVLPHSMQVACLNSTLAGLIFGHLAWQKQCVIKLGHGISISANIDA